MKRKSDAPPCVDEEEEEEKVTNATLKSRCVDSERELKRIKLEESIEKRRYRLHHDQLIAAVSHGNVHVVKSVLSTLNVRMSVVHKFLTQAVYLFKRETDMKKRHEYLLATRFDGTAPSHRQTEWSLNPTTKYDGVVLELYERTKAFGFSYEPTWLVNYTIECDRYDMFEILIKDERVIFGPFDNGDNNVTNHDKNDVKNHFDCYDGRWLKKHLVYNILAFGRPRMLELMVSPEFIDKWDPNVCDGVLLKKAVNLDHVLFAKERDMRIALLREFAKHPKADWSVDNNVILRSVVHFLLVTNTLCDLEEVNVFCTSSFVDPFDNGDCDPSLIYGGAIRDFACAVRSNSAMQLVSLCYDRLAKDAQVASSRSDSVKTTFLCTSGYPVGLLSGVLCSTPKFKRVVDVSILFLKITTYASCDTYLPTDVVKYVLIMYYERLGIKSLN